MLNKKHKLLIEKSGGIVIDNYVLNPGIMITQISKPTEEFKQLADLMNIDDSRPEYEMHAEFNSRITYMSFKDSKDGENYNSDMVNKHQHLSVYNDHSITFLLAGISLEASLELIAHNEATVCRLTSSKTNAQNNPLFKVNDINEFDYFQKLKKLRKDYLINDKENDNSLFPGRKAISMTITMSLKNWNKTLIGRLSNNGVEKEVVDLMYIICSKLHELYPLLIKEPETYFELNNGEKYR